jgi:hypothetical protein
MNGIHGIIPIVDWLDYLIGSLVLMLMVFHFLKYGFQVYEWCLGYGNMVKGALNFKSFFF